MQKEVLSVRAVILRSFRYAERKELFTLFARELGLIKCAFRKERKKNSPSVLTEVELTLRSSFSEIYLCQEAFALRCFYQKSLSYRHLQASCGLASAILNSQLQENPAPILYDLFCALLTTIRQCPTPETCLAAFQLKLLNHEGLFSLHMDSLALFSKEEVKLLMQLVSVRKTALLTQMQIPASTREKIAKLFASHYTLL